MLETIPDRFSKAKLLVMGDLMLDRFVWGTVSRISPEAPVPVVAVEREGFLLGGAANVMNNIHSLGGKVVLCGAVGDDEEGRRILGELAGMGMETEGIMVEPGRRTTVKTRVIAHQQQVVRIDREETDHLKARTYQRILKFFQEHVDEVDGVILSDYAKGLLTGDLIRKTIKRAKEARKFVIVDPKPRNFFFYKGATVVTPNTLEAGSALGVSVSDEASLKRVGRDLLKKLHCEVLIITRGEDGMAVFEPRRDPFLVPTVAREVYDVTGAGDTVIGTMGLAMAVGAKILDAARLANHAAGIVVGKRGTATVTREELIRSLRDGD